MSKSKFGKLSLVIVLCFFITLLAVGCSSGSDSGVDGDTDSTAEDGDLENNTSDGDAESDGDSVVTDGDAENIETETELDDDGEAIADGDNENAESEEEVEVAPVLPVAACNMESYDLLPKQDVGDYLEYQRNIFFDLTDVALDAMIGETGYDYLSPVPYGIKTYKFSYTTQDKGQLVEATAWISFPANSNVENGEEFPVALILHGTTGYADSCAPTRDDTIGPVYAAVFASNGYIAIAPDYIGLKGFGDPSTTTHGYTVGEQTAIGCWDALRAGEKLFDEMLKDEMKEEEKIAANGKYVIWGASQGGHAALFTELYGPYYAPEYDISGVVAAVPPLTMLPLAKAGIEANSPPTFGTMAVMTTYRAWYEKPEDLTTVFTNESPYYLADNAESLVFFDGECGEQNIDPPIPGDYDLREFFTEDFRQNVLAEDWDNIEPYSCYMKENSLLTSSVPPLRYTPTLVIFSEEDDLVVTAPMRDAFDDLCEAGYNFEYLECQNAGHSEGGLWSIPEQFSWLEKRMEGHPIESSKMCVRTEPVCCSQTPEGKCDEVE